MAAVLCRETANICNALCNACGTVCLLPCKMCGVTAELLSDVVCSPFFLYLVTTFTCNFPPVIFALLGIKPDIDCYDVWTWLFVNALLCTANMAAACYISSKIQARNESIVQSILPDTEKQETKQIHASWYVRNEETRSNSYNRMRHVLCEDPVVAIYILVVIFYMIWTSVGIARTLGDGGCDEDLQRFARNSLFCNFCFLSVGGIAFCCSICCL